MPHTHITKTRVLISPQPRQAVAPRAVVRLFPNRAQCTAHSTRTHPAVAAAHSAELFLLLLIRRQTNICNMYYASWHTHISQPRRPYQQPAAAKRENVFFSANTPTQVTFMRHGAHTHPTQPRPRPDRAPLAPHQPPETPEQTPLAG